MARAMSRRRIGFICPRARFSGTVPAALHRAPRAIRAAPSPPSGRKRQSAAPIRAAWLRRYQTIRAGSIGRRARGARSRGTIPG
jgi:hypothetical protein